MAEKDPLRVALVPRADFTAAFSEIFRHFCELVPSVSVEFHFMKMPSRACLPTPPVPGATSACGSLICTSIIYRMLVPLLLLHCEFSVGMLIAAGGRSVFSFSLSWCNGLIFLQTGFGKGDVDQEMQLYIRISLLRLSNGFERNDLVESLQKKMRRLRGLF
jgi:hypothetical protein